MASCKVLVCSFAVFVSLIGLGRGLPTGSNRIVGGTPANDTMMPYQVAMFSGDHLLCGGSILSARHVLTAAHCVVAAGIGRGYPVVLTIHAGSANVNDGGQWNLVMNAHMHESYENVGNDIAVLVMAEDFVFDAYTQPIELMEEEVPVGSEVLISGYGRVGDNQPTSDVLLYNTMYVVDDGFCNAIAEVFNTGLICFDKPGYHGACNGDSGGPAVYDGKLVGVANFIRESCGGSYPDGYAKVSFYVDWIRQFLE